MSARWFQETVALIESVAENGEWTEAARLANRLPTNKIEVQWDMSGVPNSLVPIFESSRESAVQDWIKVFPDLQIAFGNKGSLKIGFVDALPPNLESVDPAGAVYLSSPAQEDPVIEAVIALHRGTDSKSIEPVDLKNELMYAIGHRLGSERSPKPGYYMFRTEGPSIAPNMLAPRDASFVKKVIAVSDAVRKAVSQKKTPGIKPAEIFVEPRKLQPVPVSQGEEMFANVQITNRGKGVMEFRAVPDCGCFVIGPHKETIEPGETMLLPVKINTLEFVGKLRKTLYIYSNDPESPTLALPLETYVRPAYRFINQFQGSVFYAGSSGGMFETVLALDPATKLNIKKVEAVGISAVVEHEPWSGMFRDPDSDEPPVRMSGYRFKILVAPGIVAGRGDVGLQVSTDSQLFKLINHAVTVQTGIASVPASIYFGNLGEKPARASVVITRPGRPYKIKRVECDTEFITASVEPYQGNENYRIVAVYNGKARIGRFFGKVTVFTDDPTEPTVVIPLEGNVK